MPGTAKKSWISGKHTGNISKPQLISSGNKNRGREGFRRRPKPKRISPDGGSTPPGSTRKKRLERLGAFVNRENNDGGSRRNEKDSESESGRQHDQACLRGVRQCRSGGPLRRGGSARGGRRIRHHQGLGSAVEVISKKGEYAMSIIPAPVDPLTILIRILFGR